MAKEKIPSWQIKKNILDLEYRDIKESINNHIIILATISITFVIALLQNSFPQNLESSALFIFIGIVSILIFRMINKKDEAKNKLKQIQKLK